MGYDGDRCGGRDISLSTGATQFYLLGHWSGGASFYSSRVKAASQGSGLAADGTAIADIGSATTYSDPANAGGAGESETLRFKAWYYKTSDVVTPGQANATGTITLKYN
ncbi:fimbrial protein [Enterobacter hormaechei subsp. hoffmannii]|uniref:fimbrial protein n=1 Tax=Enterobacter hormaechei TaxID=158836 RepID=UPI0038C14BC0|nr:fimbrial protein [Enterobacter hormaechei]